MINEKGFQCLKIIKKVYEVKKADFFFNSFTSGGRIASLASKKIEKKIVKKYRQKNIQGKKKFEKKS